MAEQGILAGPSAPKKAKLGGYDFYRSIGSPKWVVAPMVDQSELAWRMLSRSPLPSGVAGPSTAPLSSNPHSQHPGGATLCYTPMINARVFRDARQSSRNGDGYFDLTHDEEGSFEVVAGIEGGDRPLVVQFCANDPDVLLAAAKKIEHRCDAVDINFGCPQGIAKRGHYGSFLQDEWELIKSLISTLHENLSVPVTAKFRIFPDEERTILYAKMMEAAGAQILTCHGRTREMKGQMTGLADWEIIKAVKEAVSIPVFANGNILYREDVDRCLEVTGCDGVMSAEGNLSNPALFVPPEHPEFHPTVMVLADRYLDIVTALKTRTASSAVRAHLFRLLKPVLQKDESVRDMIVKARMPPETNDISEFRAVIRHIEKMVQPEIDALGPDWKVPPINTETGYRDLPYWLAQPYIRPTPISGEGEGEGEGGVEAGVDEETGLNATDPQVNVSSHCVQAEADGCHAIAAMRCPLRACLIHCRQLGAMAKGMDAEEAKRKSYTGELKGMACEAHEAKADAKVERMEQKRKARADGKKLNKIRKQEAKQILRDLKVAEREAEAAETP